MAENNLSYPIGEFDKNIELTPELRKANLQTIKDLPETLAKAVEGLNDEQLDTEYRPGGWTLRQVVHHVADSHINSICRFKLALTEDNPTIRPYFEDRWAKAEDYKLPIQVSLDILQGIHLRWLTMLESFSEEDFQRTLVHPDSGQWTVERFLALYAWHSRHHTAHITSLRERKGW